MLPGTIIVIEGPDKVGKQTQSTMLTEALSSAGHKVKLIEVPIKSLITYKAIYWMLRNGHAKTWPNLFQTIQFLNRWFFQFKLLWFRWFFSYIIFDRWALSSIVYGEASGATSWYIRFMCWLLREPDATIILVGAARSGEVTDVYEKDNQLQADVRKGYQKWYVENSHKGNVALIDNMGTRDEVHRRIMKVLDERFGVF